MPQKFDEDLVYRTTLPITKPTQNPVAQVDVRDTTTPPPIKMLTPPEGAPNVIVILMDDMGFGAPSAFGGPCQMPNAQRLAEGGLKYVRHHTTAMCSPTRAALLTGRNHHSVGMSAITELATAFPGGSSSRPPSAAPLAEMLRLNGYNTAAFGKWHQTPTWETSQSGPFDHWPTGEGFERFYGFIGGETDQWSPTLYEGTTPIDTPNEEGYHLSQDLADRTIAYIREQQAITPDKPFFTYLAFGATHAPHHVFAEYAERYKGQFDKGWDAVREETIRRQKDAGLVPEDCELTARPDSVPAWDDLDPDRKRLFARMMEVYAGFATHTDEQVGRLVDALEQMELLDNTLIFYILGDNGASAEGGLDGTLNEYAAYNLVPEGVDEMLSRIDEIGTHKTFNHYNVGWAHAMNTPYQWTKQIASHWGGTRNGMVVHWPGGIESKNEVRTQFVHVIDLAKTVLSIAGLPEPTMVNGAAQMPLQGVDFSATFDDAQAPEIRTTQYFEIFGNRAMYHDGWTAVTIHNIPWALSGSDKAFFDDQWELYAPDDYSQAHNVAKDHPERLEKLKQLFLIEAAKHQVFPLDDRKVERTNPSISGRPDLLAGRTSMTLYPGMTHLSEGCAPDVKNRSHTVSAVIDLDRDDATGAIIAQGGRFGGWALYLDSGVPMYGYNWVDLERYYVKADAAIGSGRHTVRMEFTYDGGGPGKGGDAVLFVDDEQVASGRIDNTCGYVYSLGDTMDVGQDLGPMVVEAYAADRGRFQGKIESVTIDLDPEHHTDAEGKMQAILRRQ